MEAKFNEETQNRPYGTRFTDADILKIDLPAYAAQLKAEEGWKNRDRNAITVFKSENITLTMMVLAAGASIIPGSYEGTGTMLLQVMSGKIRFVNGENMLELSAGQVVTVHAHIPFKADAAEESICLLTMVK